MKNKKLISEHKYLGNGARIAIYLVTDIAEIPECDCLLFELTTQEGEIVAFGLRPDEAVMMIKLLADSVFKITDGYEIKLLEDV